VLGLGLNIGAYGAEVLRGALASVPRGQVEAAIALGMPPRQRFIRIVLPQALLHALPPATNLLIELLKGTSLVSLITLADLTFRANQLVESTFRSGEIFTLALLIYFVLAQAINLAMRLLERRLGRGLVRGSL
jgi:polar amino acid transport system permease protein